MDAEEQDDLVTLRAWATEQDWSYLHVVNRVAKQPGFPSPAGDRPARRTIDTPEGPVATGGGREYLYSRNALRPFERKHPEPVALPGLDPDEPVSINRFAKEIGVSANAINQHKGSAGFPRPVDGGARPRFRRGDLLDWRNSRPGKGRRRRSDG
ncbi:hypothetical protein [Nocardiopsis halophila]|uniref:hypothetical protein n=1 Tax=Nocardiopsis halophila TaxID=141692 RepID=UPI00034D62FC|nr:hypothetical protein [Nocardiopsis halophila]